VVAILGAATFLFAVTTWRADDRSRFIAYVLLACLAGAMKVRLPGMHGTYSLSFLFVLIGAIELTFSETVMIAVPSMVVQCVWRPAVKPPALQVAFNGAACGLSAAVAYFAGRVRPHDQVVLNLLLSAGAYFLTNTVLASLAVSFAQSLVFQRVWGAWFRLSLPYYLTGIVVAGVIIFFNRHFGWLFSLVLLPVMYLEYLLYRSKIAEITDRPTGSLPN
jgi:hypothetical protein